MPPTVITPPWMKFCEVLTPTAGRGVLPPPVVVVVEALAVGPAVGAAPPAAGVAPAEAAAVGPLARALPGCRVTVVDPAWVSEYAAADPRPRVARTLAVVSTT